MESQAAIGAQLGTNAELNKEDLQTFTKLREQAGYTNEELAGIQQLSLVNGKSLEDNTAEILGGAKAYASRNKLVVNEKQILKDISKASASLKLSLGGSANELARSAVQAKQFGLNLEQAEKMSQSLLDFESSIENELSAELVTGKDLNLERARGLALNGDSAAAAAEIASQVGSAADFGKMNVIQQEALAKAMGTSREELADMLVQQESLNSLKSTYNTLGAETIKNLENSGKIDKVTLDNLKTGKATTNEYFDALQKAGISTAELSTQLGDQAFKSLQAQSAQDKFNDSLEMAKQTFQKFVDGGSLDKLADFISGLVNRGALATITGAGAEEESGKGRLEKAGYTVEEGSGLFGTEAFKTTKIFDKDGKEIDSAFGSEGVAGLADMYAPKEIKKADGGIVNSTVRNITAGEAGPEAIVPLNAFYAKLDTLISAVEKGGNIYLETDKVGTANNKSTFKLNK
jgi:hypothetical protein